MATFLTLSASATTTAGGQSVIGPCFLVSNTSPFRTVYLGATDTVTVSTGFPVLPGQTLKVPVDEAQTIYFITESGVADLRFITFEA